MMGDPQFEIEADLELVLLDYFRMQGIDEGMLPSYVNTAFSYIEMLGQEQDV